MSRRKKGRPVHGWVALDKPAGMTSTRAVSVLKRLFDAQKAGHAGTLDPLATGLLAVAFGEATKTIPYIVDAEKSYVFTARWGEARDTDDTEGRVTATSPVRPDAGQILAGLPHFVGEIAQVPPAFSAVKVDGERAYDLAREGEAVELKARTVFVRRLELRQAGPDHAEFEMLCGKGTYVRAFVRDLAQALGTVGHVTALRRTRLGPFGPQNALPLAVLEEMGYEAALRNGLLPVATALDGIPALAVAGDAAQRLSRGQDLVLRKDMWDALEKAGGVEAGDHVALTGMRGGLLAIAEFDRGALKPVRVFRLDAAETTR